MEVAEDGTLLQVQFMQRTDMRGSPHSGYNLLLALGTGLVIEPDRPQAPG